MPNNNIALRYGEPFKPESLHRGLISVRHQRGEEISGRVILSDDLRTVLFLPDKPYPLGETIQVDFFSGLETESGKKMRAISFSFTVTSHLFTVDEDFVNTYYRDDKLHLVEPENPWVSALPKLKDNNLPEDYGYAQVLIDNHPPEGNYFFCPYDQWNWFPGIEPYITITDVYGTPIYYRRFQSITSDLKLHSNGQLSFYSFHPIWGHQMMDSAYRFTDDVYKMGNGYTYTDFHEFRLLDNGHAIVMTFDPQLIDMSQIVPGGDTAAIVSGFVFQELDTDKNVVFQWRSWDHYEITETDDEVDLTSDQIDYVHGNAIDLFSDTSLIISARNFNEITCVNWNTGDIIWRLGGEMNMFDFGDDSLRFSRQHFCRRIENGHVIAFDNGTMRPEPQFSSAVEYELNVDDYTATLIHRYRRSPDYYGFVMGSAQWTPEGTIVMGWGSEVPAITEFDSLGNVLYELHANGINYRAYRYPWKTNYFTFETDSFNMYHVWNQATLVKKIRLINPQTEAIEITSYFSRSDYFKVDEDFPFTLNASSDKLINIKFIPDSVGHYSDVLTLNSDINSDTLVQRIAQQVYVEAWATEGQSVDEAIFGKVRVFPNPATSFLKLDLPDNLINSVAIYNALGKEMLTRNTICGKKNRISVSDFPPGVYFLQLTEISSGAMMVQKWIRH